MVACSGQLPSFATYVRSEQADTTKYGVGELCMGRRGVIARRYVSNVLRLQRHLFFVPHDGRSWIEIRVDEKRDSIFACQVSVTPGNVLCLRPHALSRMSNTIATRLNPKNKRP
jgi:hypothetical protein